MAPNLRRKQLQKPDEFISFSVKAWQFVALHATKVGAAVVAAVVVFVAVSTWNYFSEKKKQEATAKLTRAIDIYAKSVESEEEKQIAPDKKKPVDDGLPTFATLEQKLKAADAAFSTVITDHSGTPIAEFATLLRASVRFEQARYDEAITDYQAYLKHHQEADAFSYAAKEGIAYCYEAKKDWANALTYFKQLPTTVGEDTEQVRAYQEARVLAAKGEIKEAIAKYKEILKKASNSILIGNVGQRLSLLENS